MPSVKNENSKDINNQDSDIIPSPDLVDKTNRFYQIPVFLSHPTSNTINNLQIEFFIYCLWYFYLFLKYLS